MGSRCHSRRHVRALRSPITKARTWRVRRHKTTQRHRFQARFRTHDQSSSSSSTSSGIAGTSVAFSNGRVWTFFNPDRQRGAGHAKDASDPPHTRTFMIGGEHVFAAFRAVSRWLRRQDADRATVFAEILLTPAPMMPVFDNVETAAFAAAMGMGCRDHSARFMNDADSIKNIFHHLRVSHYQEFFAPHRTGEETVEWHCAWGHQRHRRRDLCVCQSTH